MLVNRDLSGDADIEPGKGACMYRKKKDVIIYLTDKKQLLTEVYHDDPRHRMSCVVTFSQPDLVVMDVQCQMERYPHPECVRALTSLRTMIGKRVKPGIMGTTVKSIKSKACTHLVDLFHEACYSVFQGRGIYSRQVLEELCPRLSEDQISKIIITLRPELVGTCVCFQKGTDFMTSVERTPFPLDSHLLRIFESRSRSE
jgi:hypothetical protein